MNKKYLIPGVIVLLVLLAIGAFLIIQSGKDSDETNDNTTTGEQSDETSMLTEDDERTTLSNLLGSDDDVVCTWSYDDESIGDGVFYISDRRMRMEVSAEGQDWHVLYLGNTIYSWSESEGQGFKITSEETADSLSDTLEQVNTGMYDEIDGLDYDCSDWDVDSSAFSVPSNIEFTDYDALLEQYQDFNLDDYQY